MIPRLLVVFTRQLEILVTTLLLFYLFILYRTPLITVFYTLMGNNIEKMDDAFAGSAIAQGPCVGRIDRWSEWNPTSREPLWLLLSGATDPPKEIGISKRRTRDAQGDRNGVFLAGVTRDLVNMEDVVGSKLYNTVKDLYLTMHAAFRHITLLFEKCKDTNAKPMLYYTGHGEIGTGNWCFSDGTISIQEIFDMVPGGCYYPLIFSDACYSGHWANFCLEKSIGGFHCLAACPEYSTALDTKGVYESHALINMKNPVKLY